MATFKVKSLHRKLKSMGIDLEDIQTLPSIPTRRFITIGRQHLSWQQWEHSPDEADILHIRPVSEEPDSMADYFPGSSVKRLSWLEQVIQPSDIEMYLAGKAPEPEQAPEQAFQVIAEDAALAALEPVEIPSDQPLWPVAVKLIRVEGHVSQCATVEISGGTDGVDVLAQADYVLWGWGDSVELGAVKVDAEIIYLDGFTKPLTLSVGRADVGKPQLIREWFAGQLAFLGKMGDSTDEYRRELEAHSLVAQASGPLKGAGGGSTHPYAIL